VSWSKNRPNGGAVNPKYRTKEHRETVAAYKAQLARDGHLICAQPECVLRSRLILPGMRWCAGHDDTGTAYIGPVHLRCNIRDGAKRARARQTASRLRW
jgi:hypothetical protein